MVGMWGAAWEIHTSTACRSALAEVAAQLDSLKCHTTGLTHSHPLTHKRSNQEVTARCVHQGEGWFTAQSPTWTQTHRHCLGTDMYTVHVHISETMSWKHIIDSHQALQQRRLIILHGGLFFLDMNQTKETSPLKTGCQATGMDLPTFKSMPFFSQFCFLCVCCPLPHFCFHFLSCLSAEKTFFAYFKEG